MSPTFFFLLKQRNAFNLFTSNTKKNTFGFSFFDFN
jgi:hypothetical protein